MDTPSSARPPSRAALAGAVAVMCLVWGSTWVVIAEGLDDLPPLSSAAARFVIAAIVMCLVARLLAGREGGATPPWKLVAVMGSLNFSLSYGIVYWTETRLPSGLVSVLWAVFPILMAAVGHFALPGERLRGGQWFGLVLGFGGVALLFRTDLAAIEGAGWAGLVLLLSPVVSVLGTVVIKREGAGVNSLLLNRNAMLLGAALLVAAALWFERDAPATWTPAALAGVAYLALFGTVLTFGLYYWALRYAPAYQLALIAYVTPVIALVLGTLVRDEAITRSLLAGAGLVLGGVGFVMLGRRRP